MRRKEFEAIMCKYGDDLCFATWIKIHKLILDPLIWHVAIKIVGTSTETTPQMDYKRGCDWPLKLVFTV